jgi:hypothetical protein
MDNSPTAKTYLFHVELIGLPCRGMKMGKISQELGFPNLPMDNSPTAKTYLFHVELIGLPCRGMLINQSPQTSCYTNPIPNQIIFYPRPIGSTWNILMWPV